MKNKPKRYPGQLLVANPNNPNDELARAVILLVSHSNDIAIGLQINKVTDDPNNLQVISDNMGIDIPGNDPIYFGGGMVNSKVHIIHSTDWMGLSTQKINDDIAVTNDLSVLAALSRGEGPRQYRAVSGHWTWTGHDLDISLASHIPDHSIVRHRWELAPPSTNIIFDYDSDDQWRTALDASTRHQVNTWFNLSLG